MKKFLSLLMTMLMLFDCMSFAAAEAAMPEPGSKTKKNGSLVIDYSNMDEGYVMVKAAKGKKKLKVQVKTLDTKLTYDLNNGGNYEVFPLQYGNGKYTFTLYQNASGKKYRAIGEISLTANMPDELSPFLYPNQYVNYNENTAAVAEAEKICQGIVDQRKIYETVCEYMRGHFAYDYIKSVSVKPGQLPQIDDAWNRHVGICQDLSAIMVAMLRSQGIPARLVIGELEGTGSHAWVTAVVNGEEEFFDPTAAVVGTRSSTTAYKPERYY